MKADSDKVDTELADAVLEFLLSFERESGFDETTVRIVLIDGQQFFFQGLRIDHATERPGFIMLREVPSPAIGAVMVRIRDIVSVDFQKPLPDPPARPVIGFQA
jgi:hypothetical protein